MTPEDTTPDDFPPALLAAYADGELDAEAQAAVARWLADNPDALVELNAQRELGPANAALWERAEAPEPSAAAWDTVRRGIELHLNPATTHASRWRYLAWAVGSVATAAVAASVAWVAFGPVAPQPDAQRLKPVEVARSPEVAPAPRVVVTAQKPDPLAGFAVLQIASDSDVVLDRVPDTGSGWLPVGRHPLPDTLTLASFEEVHLQEVDLSPVWPPAGPRMNTAPGHAPMIFAAKPR